MLQTLTGRAAQAGAASRRPSATVSTTLQLPQDRIRRLPLRAWTASLLAQLRPLVAERPAPRPMSDGVALIANNAALIAAHAGRMSLARELCEGQFHWHAARARASEDPSLVGHCVQPWVNLARLDAMEGAGPSALERLRQVGECAHQGAASLQGVPVTLDLWPACARDRAAFAALLETMYVMDSLRAFVAGRRWAELLEFARQVRRSTTVDVVDEASIVALSALTEHERAGGAAAAAAARSRGWVRVVFLLRRTEVLAVAGAAGAAADGLRRLAGRVAGVSPQVRRDPSAMFIMARLAAACAELRLDEDAVRLATAVLEAARAVEDEAIQIEMLRVMCAVEPDDERVEALAALEAETAYARYRPRGGAPAPLPEVDELSEELKRLFRD